MNGVVVGGWEFVWAAYGITATGFAIYIVSLIVRLKESRTP
jgi:heme exporter protein D